MYKPNILKLHSTTSQRPQTSKNNLQILTVEQMSDVVGGITIKQHAENIRNNLKELKAKGELPNISLNLGEDGLFSLDLGKDLGISFKI